MEELKTYEREPFEIDERARETIMKMKRSFKLVPFPEPDDDFVLLSREVIDQHMGGRRMALKKYATIVEAPMEEKPG